jgi:tetratricopeptide (TPR) repeat protein
MIAARVLSLSCVFVFPAVAASQVSPKREPLKQGAAPVVVSSPCAPASNLAPPTDAQRRQARDLAQRALQSALLGDSTTARDELREAAALDRTNADLAYRLGRAHETVRASADAIAEYCRFLSLSPAAPEAAEVRARVSALASSSGPDPRAAATQSTFQAGVVAYDNGRLVEAEAAFSTAIRRDPQWPEPYYNRALTLLARGQTEAAARDLEQFLRLKPETDDRAAIVARIASLRRATFSPVTALAAGLALPGAGQYYTRRPVRGIVTSVAAGGALVLALMQRTTTSTVEETGTDPFGNPYTFTSTRRTRERPYAVPGSVLAFAISVGSAMDAFKYASRVRLR